MAVKVLNEKFRRKQIMTDPHYVLIVVGNQPGDTK
jgi:hypothetical protein